SSFPRSAWERRLPRSAGSSDPGTRSVRRSSHTRSVGTRNGGTVMPTDLFNLSDEVAVVLGGTGVLGGAMAEALASAGARVVAAGKGSIINIASISSILPLSRVVAYSASKAAVLNLTQWLAREWATKGVRVNAITPGFFPAEQNRRMLLKDDGTYTERGQAIVGHTPMGRFGEPAELAGVVVWLASPKAASVVTGQNIVVDGGFSSVTS